MLDPSQAFFPEIKYFSLCLFDTGLVRQGRVLRKRALRVNFLGVLDFSLNGLYFLKRVIFSQGMWISLWSTSSFF